MSTPRTAPRILVHLSYLHKIKKFSFNRVQHYTFETIDAAEDYAAKHGIEIMSRDLRARRKSESNS